MRLFSRNRERDVQGFVLHLLNRSCPELHLSENSPRLERRTNLTLPVLVVPLEDGRPALDRTFATVTKEFSATGVALVLGELHSLDEAILIFRRETKTTYVRAKAKHLSPLGAGFFQLGMRLTELIPPVQHPGLDKLAERF